MLVSISEGFCLEGELGAILLRADMIAVWWCSLKEMCLRLQLSTIAVCRKTYGWSWLGGPEGKNVSPRQANPALSYAVWQHSRLRMNQHLLYKV